MSGRGDLQRSVAEDLQAMGLAAETALGRVQGRSGYSRDVHFEDVAIGFSGRLRIFAEDFVTLNFGVSESERFESADDAVTAIAEAYADLRGGQPAVSAPGAPVRLSEGTPAPGQTRVSKADVEAVRAFLLGHAKQADTAEARREFAAAAVRLGATAEEVLALVL